ncbi:pseudouridine synthase [Mycoplasmopsis gallinarum]|uniref:pseudouridine synthase n=1 Tax=Mycoplasmopsis gallinarum TaxID=29557 RepID=UPI000564ACA8|nr:pseudouridine synthase [Mycoplasmopsis gallinarum]
MERIQKLIAQSGYCSRREAEELIKKGKVLVNGTVAKLGDVADLNAIINVKGQILNLKDNQLVYFLLNKPKKTVTTVKDPFKRQTVVDLIDTEYRIVPVGRLDYDTTGALLLTNDLEIVNKLTHPKYEIPRTYRARINEPLSRNELKQINKGVMVNGKISHQYVDQVDNKSYLVTLHVGSYHHVKELFKAFNKKVINLKRLAYANLTVEKLPEGYYRPLKLKELKDLKYIIRMQEQKYAQKQKENKNNS